MRPALTVPRKLLPGERVAVVSPSFAGPARFPARHELSMRRLRDEIGLEPVEYPTTRRLDAGLEERAADLMAAFADPSIGAILATIGGDDQIALLPHLDADLVAANPKAFVGFSDNTNLLNWLWNLGIAGYHGGNTLIHLGRNGATHPVSAGSLRAALLEDGELELRPVAHVVEHEVDWSQPFLDDEGPEHPAPGWSWQRPGSVVTGPTWGGNLEILHWNLAAGRHIRPADDYAGCVLLIETSEEMPAAEEVFRMLRNAGERGLLAQFPAALVGLAKAAGVDRPASGEERRRYRDEQRAAVLRAFDAYNPEAMLVFDVEIGHTDPQWVLPYGGLVTVDGPARRITAQLRSGPVLIPGG